MKFAFAIVASIILSVFLICYISVKVFGLSIKDGIGFGFCSLGIADLAGSILFDLIEYLLQT